MKALSRTNWFKIYFTFPWFFLSGRRFLCCISRLGRDTPKTSKMQKSFQLFYKMVPKFKALTRILQSSKFTASQSPLSDIFLDPHDITRYFAIWYDNHTILAIFHDSRLVQNLSINCAIRIICMGNTHNLTPWMHQMHKSNKNIPIQAKGMSLQMQRIKWSWFQKHIKGNSQ